MTDEQLYAIAVTPISFRHLTDMMFDVTVLSPGDKKPIAVAKFNAHEDAVVYADLLRERHLTRGHGVK